MSIKRVQTAEAATLLQLAESTFRAGFAHLNDPAHFDIYMKEAFSLEKTKAELAEKGSAFYFGMISDEVVGYTKLNHGRAQTDLQSGAGIELQRIYVVPEQQGKGIGEYLLQEAIKIARERDFPYLWLGVWEMNQGAIRFYERHGFQKFSSHTFMLGGDPQTDILMKLVLD